MIFDCRAVVGACGVDFDFEIANPNLFLVMLDTGSPHLSPFVKMNPNKTRGGIFSFSAVAFILRFCRDAEVVPAIVEAVAVLVVNDAIFGGIGYHPVQALYFVVAVFIFDTPDGVKIFFAAAEGPVETSVFVIIDLIENCVFAFAEVNPAEGVAIFVFSIEHHRPGENTVEPFGNCNS